MTVPVSRAQSAPEPPRVWWDPEVPGWLLVDRGEGRPGEVEVWTSSVRHTVRGLPDEAIPLLPDGSNRCPACGLRDLTAGRCGSALDSCGYNAAALASPGEDTAAAAAATIDELRADVERLRLRTHEIQEREDQRHADLVKELAEWRQRYEAARHWTETEGLTADWAPRAAGGDYHPFWSMTSYNMRSTLMRLVSERDEARAALASHTPQPPVDTRVGRCGCAPKRLSPPQRLANIPTCTLPAGHAGWHRDNDIGAEWGRIWWENEGDTPQMSESGEPS